MITATEARPFLWQRLEEGPQTLPEVIDLLIECGEEETALCRCLQWMHQNQKWPERLNLSEDENLPVYWHIFEGKKALRFELGRQIFLNLPIDCYGTTSSDSVMIGWMGYQNFRKAVEALSTALEAVES